MHTTIKNARQKILYLALATVFAGLPLASHAQRGPTVDLEEARPTSQDPRTAKERMLDTALDFLESPDSGIWSGPADTFENVSVVVDPQGELLGRYLRYHMGLRLIDTSVKVLSDLNGEARFTIPPMPFVPPANLLPAIKEARAWSIVARELRLDDPAGLYGEAELALEPNLDGPATLVWFILAKHPQVAPAVFVIDAQTGAVRSREKGYAEESVNVEGHGMMRNENEVDIDTLWHNHNDTYWLVDHSRGGTKVLDMQDSVERNDFYGHTYTQPDSNDWGNGLDWELGDSTTGPEGQVPAVEALWGAQRTWDMLLNTQGHNGLDGHGEEMVLRVHFRKEEDSVYTDANWDGDYANFGDHSPGNWARTEFDTVAHELGHGIWSRHVKKRNNKGEARGLNEGHGDIMAAIVMHYTYLANSTGGTVPTAERGDMRYFRDRMINPWEYQAGDGSWGLAAYVNGMENEEEHTQGTAYGHMFSILAAGMPTLPEATAEPCVGKKYSCLQKSNFPAGLNGIGMDNAAAIWFRATTHYFDCKPTFAEAREAYLKAADDLFGNPSPEYAAVQNAWYLINVGVPAEDMYPPEVQAQPPIPDNYEGSVLVEASATDDIGVVIMEAKTWGTSWKKQYGDTFKGYLDAPKTPGQYEVDIRAWDAQLQSSPTSMAYEFHNSNRLFLSRFESRFLDDNDNEDPSDDKWYTENWRASAEGIIRQAEPEGAFLGEGYIRFSGDHWMRREVDVPDGVDTLYLGFRYRVKEGQVVGSGQLRVDIRDTQGNLLEPVATILPSMDTTQDFSNDYIKETFTLSDDYAGQTIQVRFQSLGSISDMFRVDQVFMYYTGVPTLDLAVDVDEREGSVIMEADLSGIQRTLVDYVALEIDGVEVLQDHFWPYLRIQPSDDYPLDVLMTAEAIAYDHFGNPIVSSGIVDFEVKSITKVMFNGDFEAGDAYWDYSPNVQLCNWNPAGGQSHPSFLGNGCMDFSDTGTLTRSVPVVIPASALTASLSFRLNNNSPELSNFDFVLEAIDNETGAPIGTLKYLFSPNTDVGTTHKGYRKYVADLEPYKGMDFSVRFDLQVSQGPVQLYIDNVGATYSTFEGGPGGDGPGGFQDK